MAFQPWRPTFCGYRHRNTDHPFGSFHHRHDVACETPPTHKTHFSGLTFFVDITKNPPKATTCHHQLLSAIINQPTNHAGRFDKPSSPLTLAFKLAPAFTLKSFPGWLPPFITHRLRPTDRPKLCHARSLTDTSSQPASQPAPNTPNQPRFAGRAANRQPTMD